MSNNLCKIIDDINELKDKIPEIFWLFTKSDDISKHLNKVDNL